MKTILITGSNGFIGSALKQRLLLDNCNILEINSKADIADSSKFNYFDHKHIDHIFHLAAKTFVPDSWKKPQDFYHTNVLGTGNVVEFCRQKSASLTFISAYLYGQPDKLPISEDCQIRPNNPYAHSKYLAEQLCEFYANEFGVRTVIIRPFNVFGIGQNNKFLIPHIIGQALSEDKKIIVKDLTPKRDYVYLDDLIDALILSIASLKSFAVYNIGSGYSLSVKEIINIVQSELATNKEVVSENEVRSNEISDVVADISRSDKELGWYPKHSFHQGIKKIIIHEKRRVNAESARTY